MAIRISVRSELRPPPASAQHLQQVGASIFTQVAAGRNEVFAIGTANQIYRFNPGTKAFVQMPGTLAQVAVGGGTVLQKDEVWGVGTSGQIYRFNYGTKTFTQVTGSLAQIVVGEGIWDRCHSYEVWGLNAAQLIYRYNYCTKVFEQIGGSLTHIATGGGDVWGLNGSAEIFYFDPATGFVQVPGFLQQIAVGTNAVCGLDGPGYLCHFEPSTGGFLAYSFGLSDWTLVATGGDGSWATDSSNAGAWLLDLSNPSQGAVRYGNAMFVQISVGYGTGFWGVDSLNNIYTFVRP